MKFLTVRDIRSKSAGIWATLPNEQEMVITNNGRPVAILSAVSDSTLEDSLAAIRQAKATFAVNKLQLDALSNGTDQMTAEAIEMEIKAVRKRRRK